MKTLSGAIARMLGFPHRQAEYTARTESSNFTGMSRVVVSSTGRVKETFREPAPKLGQFDENMCRQLARDLSVDVINKNIRNEEDMKKFGYAYDFYIDVPAITKGRIAKQAWRIALRHYEDERLASFNNCSNCTFFNPTYKKEIRPGYTIAVPTLCTRSNSPRERHEWCEAHSRKGGAKCSK